MTTQGQNIIKDESCDAMSIQKQGYESAILFNVPFVTDNGHFTLYDKASNRLFTASKWKLVAFEESAVKLNFK